VGNLPPARIAHAHAATTRPAKPLPREPSAVSRPAAAAMSDDLAEKQTLTGYPSSTTASTGPLPAATSPGTQPRKCLRSSLSLLTSTTSRGAGRSCGKTNAGPRNPTLPLVNERYSAALLGCARRSCVPTCPVANIAIRTATSSETRRCTAHAQPIALRTSKNSGPGLGSGFASRRSDHVHPERAQSSAQAQATSSTWTTSTSSTRGTSSLPNDLGLTRGRARSKPSNQKPQPQPCPQGTWLRTPRPQVRCPSCSNLSYTALT
jgi:hypothetical protein